MQLWKKDKVRVTKVRLEKEYHESKKDLPQVVHYHIDPLNSSPLVSYYNR